jgi:hypothetical protein
MHRRLFFGLLAIFLAGQVACVDPKGTSGSTAGTSLYLFSEESGTQKLYAYTDVEALHGSSETPAPNRTITSGLFSQVVPLAWGGMVMDPAGTLYLIGESGTVVRIERVRSLNGAIDGNSSDAENFTLGTSADRLPSGKFGQAAFDGGILYVSESNSSDSRVWKITTPSLYRDGFTVPKSEIAQVTGDKGCWGLTAGSGALYGYFNDGNSVGLDALTGPRLREGTGSGFTTSSDVIVGSNTLLAKYGSMAMDTSARTVFLARHLEDSGKTGNPVLVFKLSSFSGIYSGAPDRQLADSSQNNLRVLAHGGNKDWLGGLSSFGAAGASNFWLWKSPSLDTSTAIKRTLPVTGLVEIRGLAFDGNN